MRRFVKPGVPLPSQSRRIPGHYALVRSVVEGLRAIGADFNFNPGTSERARAGRLRARQRGAPSGRRAEAPRAGSTISSRARSTRCSPTNATAILQLPEIDRLIVAHEWALEFFRDAPALRAKSVACPVRRRCRRWKPSGGDCDKQVALVYWKSGDEAFCEQVEQVVRACGLEPRRLRSLPRRACDVQPGRLPAAARSVGDRVFLSTFETQGLALAEAWAMDVPTLVWESAGRGGVARPPLPVAVVRAVSDAGHRPPLERDRRARAGAPRGTGESIAHSSRAPGCWRT